MADTRDGAALPGGAEPEAVAAAAAALAPLGRRVRPGGDLGAMTTYRVGGRAALLVTVGDEAHLALVADAVAASQLPVLVVGKGSNLLIADRGFAGIAVALDPAGFGATTVDGTSVTAGGAVALPVLARHTADAALSGFEWAVGVPGSVGGGVRMNAGGHGSDVAASLRSCRVVDLGGSPAAARTVPRADLRYGYRTSSVGPAQVVIEATFDLAAGDADAGRRAIRDIVRWRREHQPGGQNAGSVFTNPLGDPPVNSAGWLIEAAGGKGRRWRTAMVSPKHANFIQADRGGSADDVRVLIDDVRALVQRHHGVLLQTEVRMIGFPDSNPQVKVETT